MSEFTPVIVIHAVAASYALLAGAVQLARRRRGDRAHRALGWSWVVAIAVVVVSSFGIRSLNGDFTWLHALSLLTATTTVLGIVAARRRRSAAHAASMVGTYLGLVGAFAGVLAVPTRRIPAFASGQPTEFAIWAGSIMVVSAAVILSSVLLGRRTAEGHRSDVSGRP